MGNVANDMLEEVKKNLSNDSGPSFLSKWFYWKYPTSVEISNYNVQNELRIILNNNPVIIIKIFFLDIYFRTINQLFLMMI